MTNKEKISTKLKTKCGENNVNNYLFIQKILDYHWNNPGNKQFRDKYNEYLEEYCNQQEKQ